MKKFILFILLSSVCYSQQVKNQLRLSDTQNVDPFALAEKLQELQRKLTPKDRELHDIKTELQIMALRVDRLIQIQTEQRIKQQIINDVRRERLEQQELDREHRIAVAWTQSKTGRLDGRSWYNLSLEEQSLHRSNFYKHYNH